MNTYTKTLNVIDYSTMGLLSISAILAAANIPYALICFIVLWVLSIAIFITTSVKSGIYKESGSLFIYDLVIKIMIFASIEFWAQRDYVNISMAGLLVGYVIFAIMTIIWTTVRMAAWTILVTKSGPYGEPYKTEIQ